MLRLMKLEMEKVNTRNMLWTFILINISIVGIFLLVSFESEASADFFTSQDYVLMLIEMFVMAAYVIYASVLISTLIIDEFKNKTITVLFMYPIERKKILMSKVMIISGITFGCVVLSSLVVYYSFYFINELFDLTSLSLTILLSLKDMAHLVLTGIAAMGISLIPLFFGMIKHSVSATITSSILIVALLSSTLNSGANLITFVGIPLALGLAGFVVAYLVIHKAVKEDF